MMVMQSVQQIRNAKTADRPRISIVVDTGQSTRTAQVAQAAVSQTTIQANEPTRRGAACVVQPRQLQHPRNRSAHHRPVTPMDDRIQLGRLEHQQLDLGTNQPVVSQSATSDSRQFASKRGQARPSNVGGWFLGMPIAH
jgi:hypothetical protein